MRGVKGGAVDLLSVARPPEILENGGRGQFRLFSSLASRSLVGRSEPVVREVEGRAVVLLYDLVFV